MKDMMCCALAATVATALFGANELAEPEFRLPLMKAVPTVDGTVDAAEWRDAHGFHGYCVYPKDTLGAVEAMTYIGRTADRLYVASVCEIGPAGLLNNCKARRGNTPCSNEDTFEFILMPDRTQKKPTLLSMIFNFNGAYMTQTQWEGTMKSWIPESAEIKSQVVGGRWHMEWSVRLDEIGFKPELADRHGLRICRNWRRIGGGWGFQSSLRAKDQPFFNTTGALPFNFADGPAVQVAGNVRQGGTSRWSLAMRLSNPTSKELKLKVFCDGRPVNSQPGQLLNELTLAPGETRELPFGGPILGDETVNLLVSVTDAADGTVYYRRQHIWRPNAPEVAWLKPGAEAAGPGLKFAYFPSHDRMRIQADLSKTPEKTRPATVSVAIRNAKKDVLWSKELALGKDGIFDDVVTVPDLRAATKASGDGAYTLTLVAKGMKDGTVEQAFRRDVFDWEGNTLGLSDVIPAPFEKIVRLFDCSDCSIEGKHDHVKVVLRDHLVDKKTGLWKQVNAAGKDILARPMALVSGGRTIEQSEQSNNSSFSASAEWDVDGLMIWKLTLKPGHYEPMAIEIPIKAERAKLTHACADGMRYNGAGEVPAGTGRVWDSSKAPRTAIVGDYLPYVWVGGPLRGIAVCGENDKGWVIGDGKTPCQEIVREADGTVVLKLNVIQKACDLKEARTIKIGFQATPVKPMEKDWRSSPIGGLMGSCWCWGAAVPCDALAPFDGTDEFFRKMGEARRTGVIDEAYFADALTRCIAMKKGAKDYANYCKSMTNHFNYAKHQMKGRHGHPESRAVFYTNGRGVELGIPSGTTFCDQWVCDEFGPHAFGRFDTRSYALDPDRTFGDYAAWWWKKMLESGACDYLYWDDVFCQSNFDLVGNDAYRLPDGTIQPASGIFNQRAIVRRCAVLQAEMGRICHKNWVHMTNTALAPVLAFAGMNYDWEDAAADSSLQERYSKASVQAQSLGRQFGNQVAVMGYFSTKDKEKLKWLHRTGTGAVITHEIHWPRVPEWNAANKKLTDWGYRLPTTRVWNYFDEDVPFPAAIAGGDNAALAMAKDGGEAVIVVSDWDKGGDYVIRPDAAALGLKDGFTAYDLETGKDLPVSDGAVRVKLSKMDYVMIALR